MSPAPELKATLTLPQTAFPMKANLPQNEPLRLKKWTSLRLYEKLRETCAGRPASAAPSHEAIAPPPKATPAPAARDR